MQHNIRKMPDAMRDAIAAYTARGGNVTQCKPGIARAPMQRGDSAAATQSNNAALHHSLTSRGFNGLQRGK